MKAVKFGELANHTDVAMAAFGQSVYMNLIDAFNSGWTEVDIHDLAENAVECGVANKVPYDAEEHGTIDAKQGDLIYWFDGLSDRHLPVTKEWLEVAFDICDGSTAERFAEFLLCNPVENFERPLTYRWVAASGHLNVNESLCCYFCGKHLPHIKTRGQVRDLIAALS